MKPFGYFIQANITADTPNRFTLALRQGREERILEQWLLLCQHAKLCSFYCEASGKAELVSTVLTDLDERKYSILYHGHWNIYQEQSPSVHGRVLKIGE